MEPSNWTFRYVVLPADAPKSTISDVANEQQCSTTKKILSRCHPIISDIFYKDLKFDRLTSIQSACIPVLLETPGFDRYSPCSGDAIITAPTGQGKTLCYVLPIMSHLFYRSAPHVSAIVLAPTRELVTQISQVFSAFCAAPSATLESPQHPKRKSPSSSRLLEVGSKTLPKLRITCLTGHAPFVTEVAELRGLSATDEGGQTHDDWNDGNNDGSDGGSSDVIVATPGRFVEHCQTSSNSAALKIFHRARRSAMEEGSSNGQKGGGSQDDELWKHVRWIVLDEADRLLEQNYQGWVEELDRITKNCYSRPQKIVASATMTQNPEKLNLLNFDRPLFYLTSDQEGSFSIPSELRQFWAVSPQLKSLDFTSAMTKPLALLYLLHQLYATLTAEDELHPKKKRRKKTEADSAVDSVIIRRPRTVVFCGSKQTAHKLSNLLDLHFGTEREFPHVPPPKVQPISLNEHSSESEVDGSSVQLTVCNFTSSLSKKERSRIIRVFEHPPPGTTPIDILVCSDVLARGLDISELDVVINYDPPETLRSYIHRVGRTARAGRAGTTFTIVAQEEVPKLTKMMKANLLPDGSALWDLIHKHPIPKEALKDWVQSVQRRARMVRKQVAKGEEIEQTSSYYQQLFNHLDKRMQSFRG